MRRGEAIAAALAEKPSARLVLSAMSTPSGSIAIGVKGTRSTDGILDVWVALVEDGLVTRVGRGEMDERGVIRVRLRELHTWATRARMSS